MSETPEEPVVASAAAPSMHPVVAFQAALRELTPRVFVTWVLLAANVAVFLAMIAKGVHPLDPALDHLRAWGADYAPWTLNGQPWRLVTAAFVHIGAIHLGMNMLVLGTSGPLVERLFGNVGFLVLYFASALAGSVTSIAWAPDITSAGASGAIFGIYGGLFGFALRNKHGIPREAFVQLLQRAGTFVAINVVYAFSQKHIDMAAHVGGLGGGFLAGLVLARPLTFQAFRTRWVGTAIVTVATATAVAIALLVIPKPADIDGAYRRVAAVRTTAADALIEMVNGHEPAAVAVAELVEERVLPSLDAEIANLEALEVAGAQHDARDRLLRETRDVRAAYAEIASAMRAGDRGRYEAALPRVGLRLGAP